MDYGHCLLQIKYNLLLSGIYCLHHRLQEVHRDFIVVEALAYDTISPCIRLNLKMSYCKIKILEVGLVKIESYKLSLCKPRFYFLRCIRIYDIVYELMKIEIVLDKMYWICEQWFRYPLHVW